MLKEIILKIKLKMIWTQSHYGALSRIWVCRPKKGKGPASTIGLKIDSELCLEKVSVAEKFNSFYTTVVSKLVERLSESVNKFGESFVNSFYRNKGVTLDSCV